VRAFYLPFCGVEVVGAVADVLLEAERHALVCHYDVSARRVGRQRHGLFAQIAHGLAVAKLH